MHVIREGVGPDAGISATPGGCGASHRRNTSVTGKDTEVADGGGSQYPIEQKYVTDGYNKFLDPDGYPAMEPPWGTLNAIDLNKGEIAWKIPFGEFPELAAKGHAEHRHAKIMADRW